MDFGGFKRELELMHTYITAQSTSGRAVDGLLAAQTTSFCSKLRGLTSLNVEQAVELSALIAAGPWTMPQQDLLTDCVTARLTAVDSAVNRLMST